MDGGPERAGREEPSQFAGGGGDRWGMGERVAEKAGQQCPGRLDETGVVSAGVRAGQRAQGTGESAIRVGASPRVRVSEQAGDSRMHVVIIRGWRPPQWFLGVG